LQEKFKLERSYKLLSAKGINDLKQPDPEGGFFWTFPDGVWITHLSAVGFNKDKTIAFVAMDAQCGGACGHGTSCTLQKRNGKWQKYEPYVPPVVVKGKKDQNGEVHFTVRSVPGASYCAWYY